MEEYLRVLPEDRRRALEQVRHVVRTTVPDARERIAYGVVVFSTKRDLVGIASQKRYCFFYVMSPRLVKVMSDDLNGLEVSGATIHFTPDRPLAADLVRKIVQARLRETQ